MKNTMIHLPFTFYLQGVSVPRNVKLHRVSSKYHVIKRCHPLVCGNMMMWWCQCWDRGGWSSKIWCDDGWWYFLAMLYSNVIKLSKHLQGAGGCLTVTYCTFFYTSYVAKKYWDDCFLPKSQYISWSLKSLGMIGQILRYC